MKTLSVSFLAAGVGIAAALAVPAGAADSRLFEMRTYHAGPGKTEAMHARFRDHACRLFAKHGIEQIGYWVPTEEKDGSGDTLVYVLAFPDRAVRDAKWKEFFADTEWQAAFKESEKDGKLVAKFEQRFLTATDFSPVLKVEAPGKPRTFELRTYTAEAGRLPALLARFREHTLGLFAKHGITNVVYWTPAAGEEGADNTLVYLLAHASREAAQNCFTAFRADPEWIAVKAASEQKAGGSLTVKDGVKSVFLAPADYSPMR